MSGPLRRRLRQILTPAPSDVVIVSALRTPITRSYRGRLKDAYPEELLAAVLRASAAHLDPTYIEDVTVGVVLSELGGSKAGRMAMNHVGYPAATAFSTVNRACASSLTAVTAVGQAIATGMISVGIGAGMESMTRNYGSKAVPVDLWPRLRESPTKTARDCIMPMGLTAENVAARYGVSRADQDAFAAVSHQRAHQAQESGRFESIVSVTTTHQPADQAVGAAVTVDKDDGIRPNVTVESLTRLQPAFRAEGTCTAGNSSQISDGAAALVMMRRSTAADLGLERRIIGRWAGSAVVGCAPDEMGIGPALAIPALLSKLELTAGEIDLWEVNEAFASQALYCLRALGLEERWEEGQLNPNGGAIALGHPLGATGARMVADLLPELRRRDLRTGIVSMCIGTGMGMAGLFVRDL